MSTPSTNIPKAFKINCNNNHSVETLAIQIRNIQLAPSAAAEGSMNRSHTAAPSSAPEPRLEVLPLDPRIPPNAISDREIEHISLMEDFKMLTKKLEDLKSLHVFFGTGEDMVFRPIENVIKMISFMDAGLVWIRWTLLAYEFAALAPNAVPETVEERLDMLRMVMDEFFRQMYANDKVVRQEFRRIVEEEDADYQHLDKLFAGSMKLDE
ncbi:hypothetical protein EC957_001737 [Mortierella hygrophila]|uniref:Uncharacterized protein n=1 Tax=Mortierella hygrophila TaxID=979708 RepID=A0A9P6K255_9FUNG|nr:hypothetical protein EC957_001737 [Mortierella hygrophila]